MNSKSAEQDKITIDLSPIPTNSGINDKNGSKTTDGNVLVNRKKKSAAKSFTNFLYDSRRKTVLGRSSLNWAKLAVFYTIFYICLGSFFVLLLYAFALILDRETPRYHNTESTMAVRTTSTVVGMGFRPQPVIQDNLIEVSNDPNQQQRIASSLRLYRDVYLIQKADAKTEECSDEITSSDLPKDTSCLFNWFHIVPTEDHPCSDNNMYGFKNEEPCVLVKLNKVYGWKPTPGHIPVNIQHLQGVARNKSVTKPDVYITCGGTHTDDNDGLTNIIYYSLGKTSGSKKYGFIPNYFFPYRNAPDHVQPFVLVQFKDLPFNRLISVTCQAWAPHMEHDLRGMRGMVIFQLFRSNLLKNSTRKN